jgi:hypothetical protein
MRYHWREDRGQKTWLWVGLLFFVFYFVEALLFWGPEPRVVAPSFTPLVYWGLFGATLVWVVTRPISESARRWLERIQAWVLGVAITVVSVGSAFLIIRRTGDLTLGHAVLLFILALSGLVIGAMAFNAGWFVAGLCWITGGICVLWQPPFQDYILGAAVAIGFMLIGCFRRSMVLPSEGGSQGAGANGCEMR